MLPCLAVSLSAAPLVLGRCPLDRVVKVVSSRFTARDAQCLLLVQDMGRVDMSRQSQGERTSVSLLRLGIARPDPAGFTLIWTSEPLAGSGPAAFGLSGTAWAAGDLDNDGLDELLLFDGNSCRVLRFDCGVVTEETLSFPGAAVISAAVCDVNDDGTADVATIEASGKEDDESPLLVRVYQQAGRELVPHQPYSIGLNWGSDTRIELLGSARFEDYPGILPVIVGIRAELRPSTYAILYEPSPDSLVLTTNPFPWQEWFSKTRVLPAGELTLFNVEDTLVGYGYFVPGSRPSGPSRNFAALQDAEWRLLNLTDSAMRLAGLVCRFSSADTEGWLELRDNLLYLYPGDVFHWR